jgi:hypothetical protein
MYGKTAIPPVLNIRCACMVHKPSHIWILYFEWVQSQHYKSSDSPPPPTTGNPPHLYATRTFTHKFGMVKLPYLCQKVKGNPVWLKNHYM